MSRITICPERRLGARICSTYAGIRCGIDLEADITRAAVNQSDPAARTCQVRIRRAAGADRVRRTPTAHISDVRCDRGVDWREGKPRGVCVRPRDTRG